MSLSLTHPLLSLREPFGGEVVHFSSKYCQAVKWGKGCRRRRRRRRGMQLNEWNLVSYRDLMATRDNKRDGLSRIIDRGNGGMAAHFLWGPRDTFQSKIILDNQLLLIMWGRCMSFNNYFTNNLTNLKPSYNLLLTQTAFLFFKEDINEYITNNILKNYCYYNISTSSWILK